MNISFTGGDIIVFFLIQNSTLENLKLNNPYNDVSKTPLAFFSLDTLNSDNTDHFVGFNGTSNNMMQFGFEDMIYGGDADFDDVVYNVSPPLQSATGFLSVPLSYTDRDAPLQGSNNGAGPGYINSWFDHQLPNYSADGFIWPWYASQHISIPVDVCEYGNNCYDGHNGIDFRRVTDNTVKAAYSGTPFGIVNNCAVGASTCGNYYGNQVWIDHHNCYATQYGHLKEVFINKIDPPDVVTGDAIGIMGKTGYVQGVDGTHLHFGVYYDPNCDGNWSDKVVVDPFGWSGEGEDPLVTSRKGTSLTSIPNGKLWADPLGPRSKIDNTGGMISLSNYPYTATVPQGAVSSLLTFEILPVPPVSEPSASLKSTGYSFWLRVLEWLNSSQGPSANLTTSLLENNTSNMFNTPLTLAIKL